MSNEEPKKLKCNRCGLEWTPRVSHVPRACPKCKSYKWNEEVIKDVKRKIEKLHKSLIKIKP